MNRFLRSFLLALTCFSTLHAQDTTDVKIMNYKLLPGTFNWRGTSTFYDMTSWNSSQYTEGHLRYNPSQAVNEFVMNYRLLFPVGHDANYQPGYPLIVMMHGGGERGNCWNDGGVTCPSSGCYYSNYCYDPNTPAVGADPRLLNNDHNLTHGGLPHLNAVNLAGTKKPDDPTLDPRAFPGFVLFPQNLNGWTQGRFVRDAIRIIRILIKQYNIDPNRIYVHGLSNGGYGTYSAVKEADWLFAAAAPMSAVNAVSLLSGSYNEVATVPIWAFQGGKDTNPTPSETESVIRNIRQAGGIVRYSLYPNLGHGTWNTAYSEPDFFTWLLSKNKANIHVSFGSPTVCGTNGAGAQLNLPQNFPAYQWERDGQIIPGATSAIYTATIPGVYRARFSRVSATPSEAQWNRWSDPVTVTEKVPAQATVKQFGSVLLKDLNNYSNAILIAEGEFAHYYWYRDDTFLYNVPGTTLDDTTQTVTIQPGSCSGGPCVNNGRWTLVTADFDNCPSPPSSPKYIIFNNAAPTTITKPSNFAGKVISGSSIFLTWQDVSGAERGYEIWRRRSTDNANTGWKMATLTDEDITSFLDVGLEPNTTYFYKIRAVSNTARSNYSPGNDKSSTSPAQNLIISTTFDTQPPTAPQNLVAMTSGDQPPIANAGPNKTVMSPTSTVTLSGSASDPDGAIVAYAWSKVSGPTATLSGSNTASLALSSLVEGTYVFKLLVKDDNGATDTDVVTVNVIPNGTNQMPVVNGGIDKTIYLNTTSVVLNGTATDDGTIQSRLWTKVSGPTATLSGTTTNNLTASNLVAGTYRFRFTVTDTNGGSAYDEVTVLVNPATAITSIKLTWSPSSDDSGIRQYYVFFGSDSVATGSTETTYVLSNTALNTFFDFTVRAIDFAGNFSSASNQANANTFVNGLFYQHSTGVWTDASGTPDIRLVNWSNPEFKGVVSDFTLAGPPPDGPRTQDDFFNFKYDGFVNVTTGGTYVFQVTSNDAAQVWIDGVLRLQDNLGSTTSDVSVTTTGSNLTLASGPHRITVYFMEYSGNQELVVRYRGPDVGSSFVPIPTSRLKSYTTFTPPTPPVAPTNLTATATNPTEIDLGWTYTGQNPAGLKIVVLGSSTAAGTGASPGNGWVDQLRNWLAATTTGSSVINRAQNGFDSYDIMPTGTPAPATPVTDRNITYALAQDPHIILVNLPSNDIANGIPIKTTMKNFRIIKDLADAEGVRLFFTTTQPRDFASLNLRDSLQIETDSIRAAFGNYVIDIYDELTDFDNNLAIKEIYADGDGIHLNDDGHTYIFQTAQTKLIQFLTNFEIHRATAATGPFTMIARSLVSSLTDYGLIPGTTYYYKVRTVNLNGTSGFTPVVSATTLGDTEAPTAPTALTVAASTYTSASLVWTASEDNIATTGYEIYANSILIGTSTFPGYLAQGLVDNTSYTFTVRAYDASGNFSTLSSPVTITTRTPDIYYASATGELNATTTWGKNTDGSGVNPTGFDVNGQFFIVTRTTNSLGGQWSIEGSVSKVVVPTNITLTVDNNFTARVDVQGSGTVELNNSSIPEFIAISPNSTINYGTPTIVQQQVYGNLGLSGSGSKTFVSGITTIMGNLIVADGLSLKGITGNASKIELSGDLVINGAPGFVASDLALDIEFNKNGTQSITSGGDLTLYRASTTGSSNVNLVHSGTPFTLTLGASNGGGLSIANGTTFNVADNKVHITQAATINSNGETGRIAINGGDLNIASSSADNSNLYFDAVNKSINHFEINHTGSGATYTHEPVNITDALKIKGGELNAGGFVTLVSSDVKTANLQEIEGDGIVIGDVNVQRYLPAEGRIYRYMSTPVEGTTVADWQAFFPITGNFTGASTGPGLSSTPSLYYFNESLGGWQPYPPPGGSNTAPIERGVGYSPFIRNATTPTLVQVTGNPYQGNIPFTLTPGTGGNDGWNLVGNPYAATIAWSNNSQAWIKAGLSSTISVRDNPSGQFYYYDATTGVGALTAGKVSPGQAFWVQAINGTPSLTITEKAKVNEQQTYFRENADPASHLVVNLVQGAKTDPAYIVFTNSGSDNFDSELDALKRNNEGLFNLSSFSADERRLAINNTSDAFCSKNVKLDLQGAPVGSYLLTFSNLQTLIGVGQIILTDNFTNTTTAITGNTQYAFSITSAAASTGSNRFSLSFSRPSLQLDATASAADVCGDAYATINLSNTQAGVEYYAINSANQIISNTSIGNGTSIQLTIPKEKITAGNNSIRIMAGFRGCSTELLPATVDFVYTNILTANTESFVSTCEGSNAQLTASGAGVNGYYKWYNGNMQEIANGGKATLITNNIKDQEEFFVSAVQSNGCEGPKKSIIVWGEKLETPVISFEDDALFTSGAGELEWKKDGVVIPDASTNYYKLHVSGIYTVSVTKGGCTRESEPFEYMITGTENGQNASFALTVFPNPALENNLNVRVESPKNEPVRIQLIDLVGKPLYDEQVGIQDARNGIRITPYQSLPEGVYVVLVNQGQAILQKKVIIKR